METEPVFFFTAEEAQLSPGKIRRLEENCANLVEDLSHERTHFQSTPLLLEFSSNNACNLRCVTCRPEPLVKVKLAAELLETALVEKLLPSAAVSIFSGKHAFAMKPS